MSASTVKMAEVAAKQLYRIRESRLNLVTGEVDELPADGESFKLIIQQLDEQEAALTALFMGTTQTETIVKHFDYIPVEEVTNDIVFRISDLYGIVKPENLSGAPVYLSLKITEEGELPIDNKGNIKKMPKNAVAYAIPGKAEVILSDGKKCFSKRIYQSHNSVSYSDWILLYSPTKSSFLCDILSANRSYPANRQIICFYHT